MEGGQPVPEQTVIAEQPTTIEEKKPEEKLEITASSPTTEEKPATDGEKKLENTPENQEQSKYKLFLFFSH